jgi:hypothetical protein
MLTNMTCLRRSHYWLHAACVQAVPGGLTHCSLQGSNGRRCNTTKVHNGARFVAVMECDLCRQCRQLGEGMSLIRPHEV